MKSKDRLSMNGVLLTLACLLTNFSQLSYFIENEMTQIINYPIWIILFVYIVFKAGFKVNNKMFLFI